MQIWIVSPQTSASCYLARDCAALVICNLSQELLCMGLLLLVLPALSLQLLKLQVLETLCLCLEHLTVLMGTHTQKNNAQRKGVNLYITNIATYTYIIQCAYKCS